MSSSTVVQSAVSSASSVDLRQRLGQLGLSHAGRALHQHGLVEALSQVDNLADAVVGQVVDPLEGVGYFGWCGVGMLAKLRQQRIPRQDSHGQEDQRSGDHHRDSRLQEPPQQVARHGVPSKKACRSRMSIPG